MNILYGVSGEGFGHSSRALVVIKFLESNGHRVKILTYGKAFEVLKDKFDCIEIHGLHLALEQGQVKKGKTVLNNLLNFPRNFIKIRKLNRFMKNFRPDICISDFEPLSCMISLSYGLPLISIGNHQILTKTKTNIQKPSKHYPDYLLVKTITYCLSPHADFYIITSFLETLKKTKNSFLVAPIIREDVRNLKPCEKDKILVYLYANQSSDLFNMLKKVNQKFVIYGMNITKKDENLEFKTKESFLEDLGECKAIIAHGGFSLISEAIYLKKPYFAIPQKGQFEQTFNALSLAKYKFGKFSENINQKNISEFLANLEEYKMNLNNYNCNCNYDEVYMTLDKILKHIEIRNISK
ncbi:MAG: glycosyltransferase family protein [Nanoarchaeota archaeon]|nr:glycosyltransferase family protein [Nanoarchaeota archaeon]